MYSENDYTVEFCPEYEILRKIFFRDYITNKAAFKDDYPFDGNKEINKCIYEEISKEVKYFTVAEHVDNIAWSVYYINKRLQLEKSNTTDDHKEYIKQYISLNEYLNKLYLQPINSLESTKIKIEPPTFENFKISSPYLVKDILYVLSNFVEEMSEYSLKMDYKKSKNIKFASKTSSTLRLFRRMIIQRLQYFFVCHSAINSQRDLSLLIGLILFWSGFRFKGRRSPGGKRFYSSIEDLWKNKENIISIIKKDIDKKLVIKQN